jgi:NADPH-dependent 2,4-dienoyl-CoA reductase/sulfur reductase-like enzyme
MKSFDVAIIGAGPAGLAAAISASKNGAETCIIERENRAGGILKQCIHDGFGLIEFKERLTGPEYAYRFINEAQKRDITFLFNTFLDKIIPDKDGGFELSLVNSDEGVFSAKTRAIVVATGCRERSDRQIFLHGTRPAGIFTAGLAQYYINIMGYMPTRRCVILGSGDIGLIMARRLTLEGAEVLGVYEIKDEPSGLTRNVAQCLNDYNIPLYLSTTAVTVHGKERVEGVTVAKVDKKLKPVKGSERFIACDALILSVGLIPENDIIEPLGVSFDNRTGGPLVDNSMMTLYDGIFSCGNALNVNDLVDYVSESGRIAGRFASRFAKGKGSSRNLIPVKSSDGFLYVVPQFLDRNSKKKTAVVFFRSSGTFNKAKLIVSADGKILVSKKYKNLRPPEMQRLELDIGEIPGKASKILFELEEK